jgi:cytochrome d ubiquinol oxidase subunit II
MTLDFIWYLVIILSIICYAMLDGFDLGVGMLHLFARTDIERRTFMNAIGPVWDGNEVWLVIVSGALFAGFPEVFATLFATFYIPVMILLVGLIFRAVSIEFRSKGASKVWRSTWDYFFGLSSLLIAFGIGVVLGNLIEGLPLNETHDFTGDFFFFFRPYPLLLGCTTALLFLMHGSIYLVMKTEGQLRDKLRGWVPICISCFIAVYLILSLVTITEKTHMIERMVGMPLLFLIPAAAFMAILSIPLLMKKQRDGWAFVTSSLSIALLLSLFAIGTYPYMIRSSVNPEANSLLITNSAASPLTLKVLLIIVAIGLPFVFGYGFYVYRIFRGKVRIEPHSY